MSNKFFVALLIMTALALLITGCVKDSEIFQETDTSTLMESEKTFEMKNTIRRYDIIYTLIIVVEFIIVIVAGLFSAKTILIDLKDNHAFKKLLIIFINAMAILLVAHSFGIVQQATWFLHSYGRVGIPINEIILPDIYAVLLILISFLIAKKIKHDASKETQLTGERKRWGDIIDGKAKK